MNTSEGLDGPKQAFLEKGRQQLKKIAPWLYSQLFSYTIILEKLKKKTRRGGLSTEQEKRLQHFITFIDTPENIDILEYLCEMKTSKKHDIEGMLECLERAESEEKIGPQFVMDSILLFYHAPLQKQLSKEEKSACRKLKNILIKRIPKLEKKLSEFVKV